MDTKQIRTVGDGMENNSSSEINKTKISLLTKPSNTFLKSLKPVKPKSPKITLVPKYVPKERKLPKYLTKKQREPKFVPYEPYKGAVEPIKQIKLTKDTSFEMKSTKNNVEIQELVQQMSEMLALELNKTKISDKKSDDVISKQEWVKEKEAYENDIKNLRETNSHLENQLKFQAQVNSELKTLLVAAVGEDLESRVQHLTEDKLALARALLNSANHLTSHQEQTEWLSGQCEVWRSKFLASSLMVEELARWKSALSNRLNEMQEVVRQLMVERNKVHKHSLITYSYLKSMLMKIANQTHDLKYANVLELSNVNEELIETLFCSLELSKSDLEHVDFNKLKFPQHTLIEQNALQLLQNPVTLSSKQDIVCNALVGAASSLAGQQRYLQNPSLQAACCSHCKGEMQNI